MLMPKSLALAGVCLFVIFCLPVSADRVAKAEPVNGEQPVVDGALSESFWSKVNPLTDFVQDAPNNGKPATEKTEVRFVFSGEMLYVGIRAFDNEPQKISTRLQRRDNDFNSDWVVIYLDPNLDRRTGYEFRINPAGVEVDRILFDDTKRESYWDAVWDSAATLCEGGWSAELAIPFSQLRLPSDHNGVWGVNVERAIDRKSESAFWVHHPHDVSGFVSRFGRLEGLTQLHSGKDLEVVPYTLGKATLDSGDTTDDYELGADMTWRLGQSFTLDATFNPDFGQVEADPSELNLSEFETFFPEKRAFFLKGAQIFSTRFTQFFSRRIGREPGHLALDDDLEEVSRPESTRILGAAKLTGITRRGATIGLMLAGTDEVHANVIRPDGSLGREVVEPRSHVVVGRVKQDFNQGGGYVGAMATGLVRDNSYNAYTGAVDWEMYLNDRKWITRGNLITSETGPNDKRVSGWGADLALDSVAYEHWSYEFDLDYYDDGLDLNDLGFLSRSGYWDSSNGLSWSQRDPSGPFLNYRHAFYVGYQANMDGEVLDQWAFWESSCRFRNNWTAAYTFVKFGDTYNDTETRGGPSTRSKGGYWTRFNFGSDSSRTVSFNGSVRFDDREAGAFRHWFDLGLVYFPRPNLHLSMGVGYRKEKNASQWVANVTDENDPDLTHYVFGRLDSEVVDLNIRVNWTFNPNMTLQFYTQPFLAAGDYSDFRELSEPGTNRYTPFDYDETADFNIGRFTLNAVYRWEWSPGSVFFVIWNEGRTQSDETGRLALDRDYSRLFNGGGTDVFLLKFTKWFNW